MKHLLKNSKNGSLEGTTSTESDPTTTTTSSEFHLDNSILLRTQGNLRSQKDFRKNVTNIQGFKTQNSYIQNSTEGKYSVTTAKNQGFGKTIKAAGKNQLLA